MGWLGKIMTFLVLIASLVWVYFTVTAYVTRTNWKVRADGYQSALKESEASRLAEQRKWQAEQAELVRLLEAEKSRTKQLGDDYTNLEALSKKGNDDYNRLLAVTNESAKTAAVKDASEKQTLAELTDTRLRNAKLEDEAVKLVLDKQLAIREQLRAENERNLQRALAEDNARRIEVLTALVTELRQSGGGGSGTAAVLRTVEKAPAPLPDNIRGTVLRDISGDFVHISIGIDAGLEPGSKLDVYRETGGGQYLGTLTVTKSVYPKDAVAEFRPARGVPVSQLRPDELPRKGDTVGHISTGPLGRR